MNRDLRIGARVLSSDGHEVGKVDSIVIYPEQQDVFAAIVHKGLIFGKDRIVEADYIERVESDGTIHLNVGRDDEDKLREFVETDYIQPTEEQLRGVNDMPFVVSSGNRVLFTPTAEAGYGNYGAGQPFIGGAPSIAPEVTVETNLPEGTMILGKGSEVYDSEGHKVGHVEEVEYGDDGDITGLVVKEGHLFHHSVRVSKAQIKSFGDEMVHLSVRAEELGSS
jgi:uncharacterized protein YrrD